MNHKVFFLKRVEEFGNYLLVHKGLVSGIVPAERIEHQLISPLRLAYLPLHISKHQPLSSNLCHQRLHMKVWLAFLFFNRFHSSLLFVELVVKLNELLYKNLKIL